MLIRKFLGTKFFVIFALLFSLNIFSIGSLPDICTCGEKCGHINFDKIDPENNLPWHKRCKENACHSCNIEKGLSYKAMKPPIPDIGNLFAVFFITADDFMKSQPIIGKFLLLSKKTTVPSSPIYLKDQSFLC